MYLASIRTQVKNERMNRRCYTSDCDLLVNDPHALHFGLMQFLRRLEG